MAVNEALNVLFYVPSRKDFLGNGLIFVCAILLAGGFQYLPIDPASLGHLVHDPTSTLRRSLLLAGIALLVNYLLIFFAVDKYFLNWRQSASASVGTAIAICTAYSLVWGVYHLQALLAHAHPWRPLVQAVRAGTVLACLSSLPLKAWTYLGNLESLDFGPFRKAAYDWKSLALKIERSLYLGNEDHVRMPIVTKNMTDALTSTGRRQPITRESSERLKTAIDAFNAWYVHETRVSPMNLKGFDDDAIRRIVEEIRTLA